MGPFYIIRGSRGIAARLNIYPEDLEIATKFDFNKTDHYHDKVQSEIVVKDPEPLLSVDGGAESIDADEIGDLLMPLLIATFLVLLVVIATGLVVICFIQISRKRYRTY